MIKVVLLRHGQSTWNMENRFTGWTDVDLTERGVNEAKEAGKLLKKEGYSFDVVFTNILKRAINTTELVLKEMDAKTPVVKSWRLNERHYGALQGLNKSEMAAKYGEDQVYQWRRSYDVRPPALEKTDPRHPINDPLFKDINPKYLPACESLKDTVERFVPFWNEEIALALKQGKKVLISASHNSLRALVKYLDNVPDEEIVKFIIPYGVPLVYELDDNLKPITHYFLGDPKEIEKKVKKIVAQGKAKK